MIARQPRSLKVAILGGGVAGLSAAHELAERGFQVTDLLAESWLSTTEKAVVLIAHGCAILERHGGGLPVELRWQVRTAVASTTE
jgi:glycine/D-amino acid oxidase-like deaminating enzyme